MTIEILQYGFMVRALVAGSVIAVVAPVIGSFLVVRRFSLIADTLSHVALAGVAVGFLLGIPPLATTVVLTMFVALCIEQLRSRNHLSGELVLAILLPGGLAVSVILMNFTHGLTTDLYSYLFGSITTVQPTEVAIISLLGIATIVVIGVLYRPLLYAAFDEEGARVSGVPVSLANGVLMLLTAVVVSLAMRVVGVLLIGALLVIPVLTGMQLGRSFLQGVFWAIACALIAVVVGLWISFYVNLPVGSTIVLCSLGLFAIGRLVQRN